jgi:Tfp pilus assembly protein PilX
MTKPSFVSRTVVRLGNNTQRGATLIVGLIMLVLITLLVLNAFNLSSSNLKSVGNMQIRAEAIAAANEVIELKISSAFTNNPTAAAESLDVDINKDGITDYVVAFAAPTCIRAVLVPAVAGSESGTETIVNGVPLTVPNWNTDWDTDSTVTDAASGATVRIRQGVRVKLSAAQKTAVCL